MFHSCLRACLYSGWVGLSLDSEHWLETRTEQKAQSSWQQQVDTMEGHLTAILQASCGSHLWELSRQ